MAKQIQQTKENKTMCCTAATTARLWLQQQHKDTYQGCSSTAKATGSFFFSSLPQTITITTKLWSQHTMNCNIQDTVSWDSSIQFPVSAAQRFMDFASDPKVKSWKITKLF